MHLSGTNETTSKKFFSCCRRELSRDGERLSSVSVMGQASQVDTPDTRAFEVLAPESCAYADR